MSTPIVSVIMAVYNGEPWIAEAIDSILGQTLTDFELIVVDDGSTDDTVRILGQRGDRRITVLRQERGGQTAALNRGLRVARAPLLARLDADDVALPDRLERQVAFLAADPDIGLLGTGCREIAPSGLVVRTVRPPADDATLRRRLIRANPFIHSSVMFRRSVVEATGVYDESFAVAQDYDLWLRMSGVTRMATVPEPLVLRRLAPGRLSSVRDSTRLRDELVARLRAVRAGTYRPWNVVFAVRPLCALAVPTNLRRVLRSAFGSEPQAAG